jgi:ribosomal protein L16/L10AE
VIKDTKTRLSVSEKAHSDLKKEKRGASHLEYVSYFHRQIPCWLTHPSATARTHKYLTSPPPTTSAHRPRNQNKLSSSSAAHSASPAAGFAIMTRLAKTAYAGTGKTAVSASRASTTRDCKNDRCTFAHEGDSFAKIIPYTKLRVKPLGLHLRRWCPERLRRRRESGKGRPKVVVSSWSEGRMMMRMDCKSERRV